MYCSNCGKEIPEESRFCVCCGQKTQIMDDIQNKKAIREKIYFFAGAIFILIVAVKILIRQGVINI